MFLVGVPVLAVSGVLRVGERLRPPIFVGGTWNIEQAAPTDADSLCGDSLINPNRTILTISQSGSHLTLMLNDENRTTFAGEIRDASIVATITRLTSDPSLDAQGFSPASVEFHATVERSSESDRLLGALTSRDCPTSALTSFTATRLAATAIKEK